LPSSRFLIVILFFHRHPEDFSPKDPTAFSNNQPSLLWMGFFAGAQNDSKKMFRMTHYHIVILSASEGSHGFQQKSAITAVDGILRASPSE